MLGLRVQQVGAIYDLNDDAIIGNWLKESETLLAATFGLPTPSRR